MVIGVDGRCLQDVPRTGVGESALRLIQTLARLDSRLNLAVLANAYRDEVPLRFSEKNIQVMQTRIPNKLLNASIKFFHAPALDSLLGDIDLFFAPNWNVIQLSPKQKFVLTIHDLSIFLYPEFYSPYSRMWHKKLLDIKGLINRADHLIVPSTTTAQDVQKLFSVPNEKISVIPWGADHGTKHGTWSMNHKTPDRKYILFLATLEARKNVMGVIAAYEHMRERGIGLDADLVLAGPHGYGYADIERAVQRSPHRLNIHIKGAVTDEQKQALYSRASLFVYPSFYEGFGLPPLEAMSYGVPVVASGAGSLGEILGNSALLVQPYQVSEISVAMEALLGDQRLRDLYIQRGFLAAKKYRWEDAAKQLLGVFERVVDKLN